MKDRAVDSQLKQVMVSLRSFIGRKCKDRREGANTHLKGIKPRAFLLGYRERELLPLVLLGSHIEKLQSVTADDDHRERKKQEEEIK